MFCLTFTTDTCREIENTKRQFDPFSSESGLLPGFSVSFFVFPALDRVHKGTLLRDVSGISFYENGDSYCISNGSGSQCKGIVRLSLDFKSAEAYCAENAFSGQRSRLADILYHAYRYRAVSCGNMMIHAAAVAYHGDGILFCGMHEAGKSTQANLWIEHLHARAINFDQPCILAERDEILVHGTPWSGKEGLYLNESAPLSAIVFVEKANEDRAIRVSGGEAFSLIWLNNYLYPLNDTIEDQYYKVIERIVGSVPVYRLRCTKTENAVQALYTALYGDDYETAKRRISE